ncbi:PKD domain-containing protein [Fulvitalea axinellae]
MSIKFNFFFRACFVAQMIFLSGMAFGQDSGGDESPGHNKITDNIIRVTTNSVICDDKDYEIEGSHPSGGAGSGYGYNWTIKVLDKNNKEIVIPNNADITLNERGLKLTAKYLEAYRNYSSGNSSLIILGITRTVASQGVSGVSNMVTVTIVRKLTPGSLSAPSGTLCANMDDITIGSEQDAEGGSGDIIYQWESRADGQTDWQEISKAENVSLTLPNPVAGTTFYRRVASNDFENGCLQEEATDPVELNITPALIAGQIVASGGGTSTGLCSGELPETLIGNKTEASGGSGTISYTWERQKGNEAPVEIEGATGASYTPSEAFAEPQTVTYTFTRIAKNDCGTVRSSPVTIEVTPAVIAGKVMFDQDNSTEIEICQGIPVGKIVPKPESPASGGITTPTYQWESAPLGSSDWQEMPGMNLAEVEIGPLYESTIFRRTVTGYCGGNWKTVGGDPITVNVRPRPVAGEIGDDQTVCANSNPAILTNKTAASDGYGNLTYRWQKFGDGEWKDIASSATENYDPGAVTEMSRFRRAVQDECGVSAYTDAVRIDIAPEPTGGKISGPEEICHSGTGTLGSEKPGTGLDAVYLWEKRVEGGDFIPVADSEGKENLDLKEVTESAEYRRKITDKCGEYQYSNIVTVKAGMPLQKGEIGEDITVCYGKPGGVVKSVTPATGGTGHIKYQWEVRTGVDTWFPLPGMTEASLTLGPLKENTVFRRREYDDCASSYGIKETVNVTVMPELNAGTIGGGKDICPGETGKITLANVTEASGGQGTVNYFWEKDEGQGWGKVNDSDGKLSLSVDSPNKSVRFRRVAQDECDPKESPEVWIRVRELVSGGVVKGPGRVCPGSPIEILSEEEAVSAGGQPVSYQWQKYKDGNWIPVDGQTSANMSLSENLGEETVFRREATEGCALPKVSNTVTVRTGSDLDGGELSLSGALCSAGDQVQILGPDIPGAEKYRWEILRAGETEWEKLPGLTGTTLDLGAVTGDLKLRRRVFSGDCQALSSVLELSVPPALNPGKISGSQVLESGQAPDPFTNVAEASGGTGTLTYQWQKVGDTGWENIPDATGVVYSPDPSAPTGLYRRKVTDGCDEAFTQKLSVALLSPAQAGNGISESQYICYGTAATAIGSNAGAEGDYTWEYDAGDGWASVSGATSPMLDPGTLNKTHRYRRTRVSDNKVSNTVTIRVAPALNAGKIAGGQANICDGDPIGTLTSQEDASGGIGSLRYQWVYRNPNGQWKEFPGKTGASVTAGQLDQTVEVARRVSNGCNEVYSNILAFGVSDIDAGSLMATSPTSVTAIPATIESDQPGSGGQGTLQYSWESDDGSGWKVWPGTGASLSFSAPLASETSFRRIVTDGCQKDITAPVRIFVSQTFYAGQVEGPEEVCAGSEITVKSLRDAGGDCGAIVYRWQRFVNGEWKYFPDNPGGKEYSFTASSTGGQIRIRRMAEDACQKVPSNEITVRVVGTNETETLPGAKTICYGGLGGELGNAGNPDVEYQWQSRSAGAGEGAWADISGQTDPMIQVGYLYSSLEFRRVGAMDCGTIESNPIHIEVKPALSPGGIPENFILCEAGQNGTLVSITDASGGKGTISYQWEKMGETWTEVPGQTGASLNLVNVNVSARYRRVVTDSECQYPEPVKSNTAYVRVGSGLTAGTISGPAETVCPNSVEVQLNEVSPSTGGKGAVSHFWQYRTETEGWSGDKIVGATGPDYSPANLNLSGYYRRGAVGECDKPVYSNEVAVKVYPVFITGGEISFTEENSVGEKTICAGSQGGTLFGKALAEGGTAPLIYQWQTKVDGEWVDIVGMTDPEQLKLGILRNTGTYEYRRRVTDHCQEAFSNVATITINQPLKAGRIGPGSIEICKGDAMPSITEIEAPSDGFGTYEFQWQYVENGKLKNLDPESYSNPTITPPDNDIVGKRYYYRKVIDNCGSTIASSVPVSVYESLDQENVKIRAEASTVCYNGQAKLEGITNLGSEYGTVTYRWFKIVNGSEEELRDWSTIATYSINLTETTTFRRISKNLCGDLSSNDVTVTVRPKLELGAPSADQTVCFGAKPTLSYGPPSGGYGSYRYQWQKFENGEWDDINSAEAKQSSYTPWAGLDKTTVFRLLVKDDCASWTPHTGAKSSITVTVLPELKPGRIYGDRVICHGALPGTLWGVEAPSGTGADFTVIWEESQRGRWVEITSSEGKMHYRPGPLKGTKYYRRKVTNKCRTVYSNEVKVTVDPKPVDIHYNTESTQITGEGPCDGTNPQNLKGSITLEMMGEYDGTLAYAWRDANGQPVGDNSQSLANVPLGDYTSTVTFNGRCTVSETFSIPNCAIEGNILEGDQIHLCFGESHTFEGSQPSGGKGEYHYVWRYSVNGGYTWRSVPLHDKKDLTITPEFEHYAKGQRFQFRRIVVSGSKISRSNIVSLRISPDLEGGLISGHSTVCADSHSGRILNKREASGGNPAERTYSWEYQPLDSPEAETISPSGWLPVEGATDAWLPSRELSTHTAFRRLVTDGCDHDASNTVIVKTLDLNFGLEIEFRQAQCLSLFDPVISSDFPVHPFKYSWNFGDDTPETNDVRPKHIYASPGQYTVTLTLEYMCPLGAMFTETVTRNITIKDKYEFRIEDAEDKLVSKVYDQVLSASVTGFGKGFSISDLPREMQQRDITGGDTKNIWRVNSNYAYRSDRNRKMGAGRPDLSTDGTFKLDMFDYDNEGFNNLHGWIRSDSLTKYNPYGFEVESVNALNIPSSALYAYDGQLPVAVASNAEHAEVAYCGFEIQDDLPGGNFNYLGGAGWIMERFPVTYGYKNTGYVEENSQRLEEPSPTERDWIWLLFTRPYWNHDKNYLYGIYGYLGYRRVEPVCIQQAWTGSKYSVVTLDANDALRDYKSSWKGILLRYTYEHSSANLKNHISAERAHSGKKSLKISGSTLSAEEFRQSDIRLKSEERYIVAAWVYGSEEPGETIEAIYRHFGPDDEVIEQRHKLRPTGTSVEGWYAVEVEFPATGVPKSLSLRFAGATPATPYFVDDLRIHPLDGQMNSHVYDPSTLRLSATLDENNFATFYHYDYEGNLHLVKRETERGILTVQESVSNIAAKKGKVIAPNVEGYENQTLCNNPTPRVSNLKPSGARFRWYSVIAGGSALNPSDIVSSGTYYVANSDASGAESERKAVQVTITNASEMSVSLSGPATLCPDEEIVLNANVTGGIGELSYRWNFNGEETVTATPALSKTNFPQGEYEATVTAIAGSGACLVNREVTSEPITVTVQIPTPTISVTADKTTLCPDETVTFTAQVDGVEPETEIEWYIDGIQIKDEKTKTFAYTGASDGQAVVAKLNTGISCVTQKPESEPVTLTVRTLEMNFGVTKIKTAICPGGTVKLETNLIGQGPENYTVTWFKELPDGGTQELAQGNKLESNGLNPDDKVHAEIQADCYTPFVTETVAVRQAVIPTVSLDGNPKVCPGASVTVNAVVSDGRANSHVFEWYLNGNKVSGESGNELTIASPNTGDQIKAKLILDAGCGENPETATMTLSVGKKDIEAIIDVGPRCSGSYTSDPLVIRFVDGPKGATVGWYRIPYFGDDERLGGGSYLNIGGSHIGLGPNAWVYVKVDGDNCYNDFKSETLTVQDAATVTPSITITPSHTSIIQGGTVSFNCSSQNVSVGGDYSWYVNDQLIDTNDLWDPTFTHTFNEPGTYVIKVEKPSSYFLKTCNNPNYTPKISNTVTITVSEP